MDDRRGLPALLGALGLLLCLGTALAQGPANTPAVSSRTDAPAVAGKGKAIQPWVTERMEEKYCHRNDHRTPILPPIKEGARPACDDSPTLDEVLRTLPAVSRGVPYCYEESREGVRLTCRRVKDVIDPPRFFPLVGPAQLHHVRWKCTLSYTETVETNYPFPFTVSKPCVRTVYLDRDHLHLYTGGPWTSGRDPAPYGPPDRPTVQAVDGVFPEGPPDPITSLAPVNREPPPDEGLYLFAGARCGVGWLFRDSSTLEVFWAPGGWRVALLRHRTVQETEDYRQVTVSGSASGTDSEWYLGQGLSFRVERRSRKAVPSVFTSRWQLLFWYPCEFLCFWVGGDSDGRPDWGWQVAL